MKEHESPPSSRDFRARFPEIPRPAFQSAKWRIDPPAIEALLHRPRHATLLHALASAALESANRRVVLVDEDEDVESSLTYAELWAAVRRAAHRLGAGGVRANDRVLLVLPTSLEFVVTFFAIQLLGAVPVPSYPPATVEHVDISLTRLEHIGRDARVTSCVTSRSLTTMLGALVSRVPTLRTMFTPPRAGTLDGALLDSEAALASMTATSLAFVQYTSGSTGRPKGVALSHSNVLSNVHAIGLRVGVTPKDGIASWLPLYHDMGLIGILFMAVYWQLPVVLMSPRAFLAAPTRWLHAITRHRTTLGAAPNFAYGLCVRAARLRPGSLRGIDLSSWRVALNGSEHVSPRTAREFCAAFADYGFAASALTPVYGLAESSLAVTIPVPGTPLLVDSVDRAALADGRVVPATGPSSIALCGTGVALEGHDVVVADDHMAELPECQVGHILARGPSVMQGYLFDTEVSAGVLREGWLWTGDLGYKRAGALFVTGRVKDLVILRGKNYYAEDIEAVIERVPGVRPGGVVVFSVYDDEAASEVVSAVCESKETDAAATVALADAVRAIVSDECGLVLDDAVIAPPGTIPKTSSGKRQRSRTREMYLADELAPAMKTRRLGLACVVLQSAWGHLSLLGKTSDGEEAP